MNHSWSLYLDNTEFPKNFFIILPKPLCVTNQSFYFQLIDIIKELKVLMLNTHQCLQANTRWNEQALEPRSLRSPVCILWPVSWSHLLITAKCYLAHPLWYCFYAWKFRPWHNKNSNKQTQRGISHGPEGVFWISKSEKKHRGIYRYVHSVLCVYTHQENIWHIVNTF